MHASPGPRLRVLSLCLCLALPLPALAAPPPLRLASHDMLYIEILKPLPFTDVETKVIHRNEPVVPQPAPDAAGVLKTVPGSDVNRNGALTGIVQYRGMYGDRVDVHVDGMYVGSAGPNAMDPPLALVPRGQLQAVVVHRGIAPVSAGIGTFGGAIEARSLTSHFGDGPAFHSDGLVRFDGSSADRGRAFNLFAGYANDRHRMHLALTREAGSDRDTPLGRLHSTRFERDQVRAGYGFRSGTTELDVEARYNDTGKTGTPSLPMDILYIRGTTGRIRLRTDRSGGRLDATLYGGSMKHEMDNFSLRPNGIQMHKQRLTHAESDSIGIRLGWRPGDGRSKLGVDLFRTTHDARIKDPTRAAFFVDNFRDVRVRFLSLFGEREGKAGRGHWSAGLRLTRAESDAGTVDTSMAMTMPAVAGLRDRFNAADRSRADTLVDAVFEYSLPLSGTTELVASLGHKMRSPSYQERYLWLPLESTGGLADGNTYVGKVDLKPERSWQFELGFDTREADWTFSPRLFYRRIDDYIQGIPATDTQVLMVNNMMGGSTPPPVLQFANVDAKIYGFDALAGWAFAEGWRLEADLSWTRGARRDIDDNLYRIAPPRLDLDLRRRWSAWEAHLGLQAYARQKRVSATNHEQPTSGYAVWSAGLAWRPDKRLRVRLDVDNLADRRYYDHVGGYNRVAGNIVPVGSRLPGTGRNVQLRVHWRW